MEENTAPEGRWAEKLHWLENVFWYHYKWYYFAAVFLAVFIIASLVSLLTRVNWDWTVRYVHAGASDPAAVNALKKQFTAVCTDETGNGRVQVRVLESFDTGDPGRRDILGLLQDSENVIYVLDEETFALYGSLGYFPVSVPMAGGLTACVHSARVEPFTYEEYSAYGYTQEQIDESNAWMAEQHELKVQTAEGILQKLN